MAYILRTMSARNPFVMTFIQKRWGGGAAYLERADSPHTRRHSEESAAAGDEESRSSLGSANSRFFSPLGITAKGYTPN